MSVLSKEIKLTYDYRTSVIILVQREPQYFYRFENDDLRERVVQLEEPPFFRKGAMNFIFDGAAIRSRALEPDEVSKERILLWYQRTEAISEMYRKVCWKRNLMLRNAPQGMIYAAKLYEAENYLCQSGYIHNDPAEINMEQYPYLRLDAELEGHSDYQLLALKIQNRAKEYQSLLYESEVIFQRAKKDIMEPKTAAEAKERADEVLAKIGYGYG